MNQINLIIVDDHPMVRDGIAAMLRSDETINIIGEAANQNELLEIIDKQHAVRIADRQRGYRKRNAGDFQGLIDMVFMTGTHRDFFGAEFRYADRDADFHPSFASFNHTGVAGLPGGLYRQAFFSRMRLVHIRGHTAQAVTAFFRPGTVGIEHVHRAIGSVAVGQNQHAVGADPAMPVTDFHRQPVEIERRTSLAEQIDNDKIIAQAVIFDKCNLSHES